MKADQVISLMFMYKKYMSISMPHTLCSGNLDKTTRLLASSEFFP